MRGWESKADDHELGIARNCGHGGFFDFWAVAPTARIRWFEDNRFLRSVDGELEMGSGLEDGVPLWDALEDFSFMEGFQLL